MKPSATKAVLRTAVFCSPYIATTPIGPTAQRKSSSRPAPTTSRQQARSRQALTASIQPPHATQDKEGGGNSPNPHVFTRTNREGKPSGNIHPVHPSLLTKTGPPPPPEQPRRREPKADQQKSRWFRCVRRLEKDLVQDHAAVGEPRDPAADTLNGPILAYDVARRGAHNP